MRDLETDEEPPIIVRAHSTPIEEVMAAAVAIYGNLYTMCKYNGESLTSRTVRGEVRRLHESLARPGSAHIVNVHILANLEPFRWGSPSFIQDAMKTCQEMGAQGLHLYPLRYWDWPVTADVADPPLLQIDRDWLWFAAWARYAWNPNRDQAAEQAYWVDRIATRFGSAQAAVKILEAYETFGECAPRLLRRFGITSGNRQCLALGMRMTHLINPDRHHPEEGLSGSMAPPGEGIDEWVRREWQHEPPHGETPPQVVEDALRYAQQAVDAAEAARPLVTKNRDEFDRLRHDVHSIQTMCQHYAAKVQAAQWVLRYGYSRNLADLARARPHLEESVRVYRKLAAMGGEAYRDAGSLQIAWRSIPFVAGPNRYVHWQQCLPEFEKEAEAFRRNLARLGSEAVAPETSPAPGPLTKERLAELDLLFEPIPVQASPATGQ